MMPGPKASDLGRGSGDGIGKGLADGVKSLLEENEVMVSGARGRDTTPCGPGQKIRLGEVSGMFVGGGELVGFV